MGAAPEAHPFIGAADSRWIEPAALVAEATAARDAGYFFESMTCVDRIAAKNAFELIYTFNKYESQSKSQELQGQGQARLALRVLSPAGAPVPSLAAVWPIAAWNEREAWEFYGVVFEGHPNLTWLLLPEETEFHPLLKSFTAPPPSIYDDSMMPAE